MARYATAKNHGCFFACFKTGMGLDYLGKVMQEGEGSQVIFFY